jgi:hypothetical protein
VFKTCRAHPYNNTLAINQPSILPIFVIRNLSIELKLGLVFAVVILMFRDTDEQCGEGIDIRIAIRKWKERKNGRILYVMYNNLMERLSARGHERW